MNRKNFKILLALTTITHAGLSVFAPALVLGFLSKFLINKFSVPDGLFLISIVFGILCGFYNMIKYIYIAMKKGEDE